MPSVKICTVRADAAAGPIWYMTVCTTGELVHCGLGLGGNRLFACAVLSTGQATRAVTPPAKFEGAWEWLASDAAPPRPSEPPAPVEAVRPSADAAPPIGATTGGAQQAATQFLLHLMRDETVALAFRIDAARALLQHAGGRRLRPND